MAKMSGLGTRPRALSHGTCPPTDVHSTLHLFGGEELGKTHLSVPNRESVAQNVDSEPRKVGRIYPKLGYIMVETMKLHPSE